LRSSFYGVNVFRSKRRAGEQEQRSDTRVMKGEILQHCKKREKRKGEYELVQFFRLVKEYKKNCRGDATVVGLDVSKRSVEGLGRKLRSRVEWDRSVVWSSRSEKWLSMSQVCRRKSIIKSGLGTNARRTHK